MKVAIYCRLSEEDREKQSAHDDSGSIENQKNMLTHYAEGENWEIYHIYSDDDYAGADRNRPGFCRLLEEAQERKFDIVLCKTQSRFTRELELVEKYIHGLFPALGIRFVSIVDHADTDNKGNKKARQINGLMNEWYLEDMSENIRSVLTSRRQRGLHIGSFALYGYEKDPEAKGHLRIDPDAAEIVREVFSLYSQGVGKTAIARLLNERAVPNPSEYKRRKGLRYQQAKGKTGTLWKYPTVSSMLSNEMYRGHMVQGRYGSQSYKTKENKPRPPESWIRVEGTHEAIITEELWKKVAIMRESKAKPFTNGRVGLFAGKAKCQHCGYTLRSRQSRGKYYLQCPTNHVSPEACQGTFIGVEYLAELVLDGLADFAEQSLDRGKLSREVALHRKTNSTEKRLEEQKKTIQHAQGETTVYLRHLYEDKVKAVISQEDFTLLSLEFQGEKKRLELALEQVEQSLTHCLSAPQEEERIWEEALKIVKGNTLTHLMVSVFVEFIFVGKRLPGSREVPVEIHWNF